LNRYAAALPTNRVALAVSPDGALLATIGGALHVRESS
jgi:hypothetical protein